MSFEYFIRIGIGIVLLLSWGLAAVIFWVALERLIDRLNKRRTNWWRRR